MKKIELVFVRIASRCQWRTTYIPAKARGPVNSRTRRSASRPSPSICITTKSSEVMLTSLREAASRVSRTGTKSSFTSLREQTTEHSTGVTEMLMKGCSLLQPSGGWTEPSLSSELLSIVEDGNTNCRTDCRKLL